MFHKLHLEDHKHQDYGTFADRHTGLIVLAVMALIFGLAVAIALLPANYLWLLIPAEFTW